LTAALASAIVPGRAIERMFREGVMANDVVFIGWNRPMQGREHEAAELFGQSMAFYEGQKKAGNLASYEPFLLDPHGGELNGFVLLRGTRAKLDAILASDEFQSIIIKGMVHIADLGVIHGVAGEAVPPRIGQYMAALPKR
jgi:hypothetical protein